MSPKAIIVKETNNVDYINAKNVYTSKHQKLCLRRKDKLNYIFQYLTVKIFNI